MPLPPFPPSLPLNFNDYVYQLDDFKPVEKAGTVFELSDPMTGKLGKLEMKIEKLEMKVNQLMGNTLALYPTLQSTGFIISKGV